MSQQSLFGDVSGAVFSDCRTYRYVLHRGLKKSSTLNYIMLNPSTADAVDNDPTVERCKRRAEMLGYDRIVVTNLFALRSTDPKGLKQVDDPVGPENDRHIIEQARCADMVICAWGSHGSMNDRSRDVVRMLRQYLTIDLHYLELTQAGEPCHPLYLPYGLKPKVWF